MKTPFIYLAPAVQNVEAGLSIDRFGRYLADAKNDRRLALEAVRVEHWVSAAFYIPLQVAEVALRNACDRDLTSLFGANWHTDAAFVSGNRDLVGTIADTKNNLRSSGLPVDTPHIVAALSFGFWTRLFARSRDRSIWTPGLHRVFIRHRLVSGSPSTRAAAAQQLQHLRLFRNRIAHHEPIYHRALAADLTSVITLAECLYEDVGAWSMTISSCSALLREGSPLHRKPGTILGWCGHFR